MATRKIALGLWALLIAATFTFAGARFNQVLLDRLIDDQRLPADRYPRTSPAETGIILLV
jgi:hypothetical protein